MFMRVFIAIVASLCLLEILIEGHVMTEKQFKNKLNARLRQRLKIEPFEQIAFLGSKLYFQVRMAILDVYPFEIPEGSNEKDYEGLLTIEQYDSGKFDKIIDEVFYEAMKKYCPNDLPV